MSQGMGPVGPDAGPKNVDSIKENAIESSPEQRAEEIRTIMKELETFGLLDEPAREQERQKLEANFAAKIVELKQRLGAQNITEKSEGPIHKHLVEEVVDCKERVFDLYQQLSTEENPEETMEELGEEKERDGAGEPQSEEGEEEEQESGEEIVREMAAESISVGAFQQKLQEGAEANNVVAEAQKNMEKIGTAYDSFRVDENLPSVYGGKAAGITQMGTAGGGAVTIEAEHLASVVTEEGADDVHITLAHEAIHQKQANIGSRADVAVVDTKSDRLMTGAELQEGGAVKGTAQLGGVGDVEAGDVYKQGYNFYQRVGDERMINEHLNKGGKHAGDRVHLQAELARDANVTDIKKLKKIADRAHFTGEEKKKFFQQLGVAEEAEQEEDRALAA